jgi:hypothetical protein
MPQIYTAEIVDRPVAVFSAANEIHAGMIMLFGWFRDCLAELERDGEPTWDGTAEVKCRQATEIERAYWRKSVAAHPGANQDEWMIFLGHTADSMDSTNLAKPSPM